MESFNIQSYPKFKQQVVLRNTHFGDYLLSEDNILKINESVKKLVKMCDGTNTIAMICEKLAVDTDENEEAIYEKLEELFSFLYNENLIEFSFSEDFYEPVYNYKSPLSIIWEITYACNLQCDFCIAKAGTPIPKELNSEDIESILNELISLNVNLINITGGEPLLRKDLVLLITKKAVENGIKINLLTNGTLVTEEIAKELFNAGIKQVQVSVDSVYPDVHDKQRGVVGSWNKAINGIKLLKNVGMTVTAAAVVTKSNFEYFKDTRQFLGEIADKIKIGPVLPMGRGFNNDYLLTSDMIYHILHSRSSNDQNLLSDFIFPKQTCSIGSTPVITPTGDVYPCMLTKYEELKLGNLKNTTLELIYESKKLQELCNWNIDKIEPCNKCKYRYYCGAGCRGSAYAYHGSIYKNDAYYCAARKRFAAELLKNGDPVTKKALRKITIDN